MEKSRRRIGIDARLYGVAAKGLGRYTAMLIAHLQQVADAQTDFYIFILPSQRAELSLESESFHIIEAPYTWYSWQEQILFPRLLRRLRLDCMHFPHFNVPFFYRRPFVVTIHDLILRHYPSTRATTLGPLRFWIKYLAYRAIISHAIHASQAIIAVSNFTKSDILSHYSVAADKITVTYEAPVNSGAGQFNPQPQPYFLYVGNAYPHKNVERLITAYAQVRKTLPSPYRLILVGEIDYFYERLQVLVRELGMTASDVEFRGRVTDSELSVLYHQATAYVFPSLWEGFGLPGLEAMSHGVPVLAANRSCLPEIYGPAALYFDPEDVQAIVAALQRIVREPLLRQQLQNEALGVLARYSWSRMAGQTWEIYKKIGIESH